jgi:hypothetical protein
MTNFNTLSDIESAIEKLTPEECDDLRRWFDQYHRPQPIDTQLKADLDAGKMDDRIRRAAVDHKTGRTQSL